MIFDKKWDDAMKNNIRKFVGILLIIIGIGIFSWVAYTKYTIYKEQQKLKDTFNQVLNQDNKKITDSNNDVNNKSDIVPIAILKIQKINLDVAVGEGVDDKVLDYAIGHFPNTAMAGEKGNFALAGHRNFTYAEYFKDLDKLKIGDDIIVKTKEKEINYKVTDSFVVDPTDVKVLDATKDATITLVTCTEGAKKRLIIKGVLSEWFW